MFSQCSPFVLFVWIKKQNEIVSSCKLNYPSSLDDLEQYNDYCNHQ